MLYSNKVFLSELIREDRWEAKYYHPKYIRTLNLIKKFSYQRLENLSVKVKKGIFDLSPDEYKDMGVPFIRISNIKNLTIDEYDLVYISNNIHNMHPVTSLSPKDVVFSKIGSIGKLAKIPSYMKEVNISQNIIGVSIKSRFNKDYIFAFLLSKYALLQLEKKCKQQLQDKLNLDDVKDVLIPLINKSQQDRIANLLKQSEAKSVQALDKIKQAKDFFINRLNLKKSNKENFYKVNYKELSDLWIPKFYYPLYQNTIEKLKKRYKTLRLGEIVDISKGDEVGSENYNRYLEKTDTDVPFIRTSDIVNYEIDNYPDFYISEDIYAELSQDIKAGDILFTKDGKIGLSAILLEGDKCIIASGFARLRVLGKFSPFYIFIVLSTLEVGLYQALQRTVIAATIPHLRTDKLAQIEIPILDDDSQKKISKLVEEAFILKKERKILIKKAIDMLEMIMLG